MKKVLSLMLALAIIFAVSACPVMAANDYGKVIGLIPDIEPGDTRRDTEYSYAWLDQLIVRDDAMAIVATTLIPKPTDYPYSHTYSEFIDESKAYAMVKTIDEETVASSYEELMKMVYYTVVAMGMSDDYSVMAKYLREKGISAPNNPTSEDKMNVTVVYAALKFNAMYALYEKEVSIPKGVSAEGAAVIVLASLSGIMLPSGINTYTGLASYTAKNYVAECEDLPLSKNPDSDEIFYWVKVLTASSGEYDVPGYSYDMVGKDDKEYVDYAYFATVLNGAYDTHLDPEALAVADSSSDDMAIQRLLLETMLTEKNVSFDRNMDLEDLFDYACESGCFNLEEEFYTDVFNYDIKIGTNRSKIWFTPFAVADQLDGGVIEAVSMTINGQPAGHNKTTGIALDSAKKNETIALSVKYNDGTKSDEAVYTFNVIKDPALNSGSASDNNLVAEVGSIAGSLNPSGNDKVSGIIDDVLSYAEEVAPSYSAPDLSEHTTFPAGQQGNILAPSAGNTDGYEFSYLGELMGEVYETDANGNIVTTKSAAFAGVEEETTGGSIIEKATTVVKENPEIVAAPTGIITLGALAGYLMTKKHKDNEMIRATDDEEIEDDE